MFTCASITPLPTLPGTSRTAIVSSQQRACNWSHCKQIKVLSEGVGFCLLPPSYPAKQSLPSPYWGRTLTCMASDTWRNSPGCPRRRRPAAYSSSTLWVQRRACFLRASLPSPHTEPSTPSGHPLFNKSISRAPQEWRPHKTVYEIKLSWGQGTATEICVQKAHKLKSEKVGTMTA